MRKFIFALIFMLALAPTLSTNAATTMRDISIYLYHDYSDCVFMISWENSLQSATVQIRDPDDFVITANSQNTEFSKGGMYVNVGTAKSGYWTVEVTGDNLGAITVSGGSKSSSAAYYNAIQSFDTEVSNGYINFKWNVVTEQDTINVSINAYQDNYYNNRGGANIWKDSSAIKSGTASVSVDDLKTGLYSFTIQVYDGNMQYTLSTEEPLYVKQSNALTKLEGIKVGSIDGEMFATWDARPDSTYMVTLYDYDTLAVLENKNTNNNFYSISLDNEHNMVKFSVAETNKYIYGDFDIFDIVRSTPVGVITFPDYSFTRENLISFSVTCPTDTTAGVYLDGALILENANAGIYDLHLAEGVHEILAYVKDNNGNIRTFSKTMMVDITPPAINLTNPNNVKTSDDNIIISGNTEPNAVVSINGVEQELGYGNFIVKLNIDKGVNVITVSAYDAAGNKNVKTITADRTNAFGSSWTEYIAPILLFVLLSAWYISLNKKAKEAKPNEEIN